jgi:hypothetical protein
MTDEQKYWYLLGYLESLIASIVIDMKIPEPIVRKWLVYRLADTIGIKL